MLYFSCKPEWAKRLNNWAKSIPGTTDELRFRFLTEQDIQEDVRFINDKANKHYLYDEYKGAITEKDLKKIFSFFYTPNRATIDVKFFRTPLEFAVECVKFCLRHADKMYWVNIDDLSDRESEDGSLEISPKMIEKWKMEFAKKGVLDSDPDKEPEILNPEFDKWGPPVSGVAFGRSWGPKQEKIHLMFGKVESPRYLTEPKYLSPKSMNRIYKNDIGEAFLLIPLNPFKGFSWVLDKYSETLNMGCLIDSALFFAVYGFNFLSLCTNKKAITYAFKKKKSKETLLQLKHYFFDRNVKPNCKGDVIISLKRGGIISRLTFKDKEEDVAAYLSFLSDSGLRGDPDLIRGLNLEEKAVTLEKWYYVKPKSKDAPRMAWRYPKK